MQKAISWHISENEQTTCSFKNGSSLHQDFVTNNKNEKEMVQILRTTFGMTQCCHLSEDKRKTLK